MEKEDRIWDVYETNINERRQITYLVPANKYHIEKVFSFSNLFSIDRVGRDLPESEFYRYLSNQIEDRNTVPIFNIYHYIAIYDNGTYYTYILRYKNGTTRVKLLTKDLVLD